MEALDAIERRIDTLTRLVGTMPATTADDTIASSTNINNENLTDSVLSANTLIASALSGRQKIGEIVNRTDELEQYLDPAFLDAKADAKAKEVYVNTVAPELAATFEQLEQIKRLEPSLGAEYFRNIPDVTDQLRQMNDTTAELGQKNDLLEESLTIAMQRYDEIQSGIKDSLAALNDRIVQLEQRVNPKKTDDDVIDESA